MTDTRRIYSENCWLEGKLQPATICFTCGEADNRGIITGIYLYKLIDAEDIGSNILMPGIIDAHVHINEPGRTDWEGFETATQAAAAGGITTIIDMPLNSSPVTTNVSALQEKLSATENKLNINVGFYGGLIPGNIDELDALIDAGVLGIKCFLVHSGIDEFPNVGENDLNKAMPLIAKYDIPLLAHCEIYSKEEEVNFSEFPGSYQNYLASRPKKWENDAVELMINLCRKHGCAIHIVHVSSAEALESIANAKSEGLPVTAETCAHYIYFNAENIPNKSTIHKCAPPIREKQNNQFLKEALLTGILDFITTDHSPAPPEIKKIESGNFMEGWGGIAGLQLLLPGSWTALKEMMSLENFIPLLTENPAGFLKINDRKGKIQVGFDADLVIWNPEEKQLIKGESILHRHKISPYIGEELFGSIKQTIVNGFTVYKNNTIVNGHIKNGKVFLRNRVGMNSV